MVYYYQGRYEEALAALNTAIQLNPRRPDAYSNRSLVYRSYGRYQEAFSDSNRAIELLPTSDCFVSSQMGSAAYNNRGGIYSESRQYQDAIADFKKAIELDSNSPMPYFNWGVTYLNVGYPQQASEKFQQAKSLCGERDPGDPQCQFIFNQLRITGVL